MLPTWKQAEASMSVPVNGMYLRFTAVPDAMQRFVRPALFATGYDDFELRNFGTAFLAKYRGWSFGLTTSHQTDESLGAPSAETFVVLVKSGDKQLAVPPSAFHKPRFAEQHQAFDDLTVFDFDEVPASRSIHHLDLSNVSWSDAAGLEADYSFLVGYPTKSIEFTSGEDDQLSAVALRWIRQDLERTAGKLLDPDFRDFYEKPVRSTRLSIDPDGLSGSPVFSIVNSGAMDRHLRFDGIVTHAKGDRFAVYPSAYLRRVLDLIIEGQSTII